MLRALALNWCIYGFWIGGQKDLAFKFQSAYRQDKRFGQSNGRWLIAGI